MEYLRFGAIFLQIPSIYRSASSFELKPLAIPLSHLTAYFADKTTVKVQVMGFVGLMHAKFCQGHMSEACPGGIALKCSYFAI
jgi:hypothetical protein